MQNPGPTEVSPFIENRRARLGRKLEGRIRMPESAGSAVARGFKVHLAVIQPTSFCNINCAYCYLPGRAGTHKMAKTTLERTFHLLLRAPHHLTSPLPVSWHASEPLVMPQDFYTQAFELQKLIAPAVSIENCFQTNATLLNQDWCDFIKHWNIRVGISVDGPKWIHDANRVDRAGRGTFDRVRRGIELLQTNGIEFSAIGVLSRKSLEYPDEIWAFFRDISVDWLSLNFEDVEGAHSKSSLSDPAIVAQAREFFARLLRLRNRESSGTYIRELDFFLERIAEAGKPFRRIENIPLAIVGCSWDGNLSTFSPELIGIKDTTYGEFVFGNVARDTLDSIRCNLKLERVYDDIQKGVQRCRETCEYFCVCGGGIPSNKLHENGTFHSTKTLACRLRIKTLCDVVMEFLEQESGVTVKAGVTIEERIAQLSAVCQSCIH